MWVCVFVCVSVYEICSRTLGTTVLTLTPIFAIKQPRSRKHVTHCVAIRCERVNNANISIISKIKLSAKV